MYNENAGESDIELKKSSQNRCSFCEARVSCQELKQDLKLVTQQMKSFQRFNKERWRRLVNEQVEEMGRTRGFTDEISPCVSLIDELRSLIIEGDKLLTQIHQSQLTCPALASKL